MPCGSTFAVHFLIHPHQVIYRGPDPNGPDPIPGPPLPWEMHLLAGIHQPPYLGPDHGGPDPIRCRTPSWEIDLTTHPRKAYHYGPDPTALNLFPAHHRHGRHKVHRFSLCPSLGQVRNLGHQSQVASFVLQGAAGGTVMHITRRLVTRKSQG